MLSLLLLLQAAEVPEGAPPSLTDEDAPAYNSAADVTPSGVLHGDYKIGPGDTLQVQVYGEPSLSGSFPVNAAGALDFPLLGPVPVSGLTTAGAVAELKRRLQDGYVRDPSLNVWITNYHSQPVQVLGAVGKPGIYFLQGPTTVLEILSQAGGVNHDGVNEVRITHGNGPPVSLPYEKLLTQGPEDVMLSAGDVIYVPQTQVSVMGYVGKPGPIPYRDDLTVSLCIAAAGGALPTAALGQVYILRGTQRIHVNLKLIFQGKAPDLPVKPGDRIVVQQSAV